MFGFQNLLDVVFLNKSNSTHKSRTLDLKIEDNKNTLLLSILTIHEKMWKKYVRNLITIFRLLCGVKNWLKTDIFKFNLKATFVGFRNIDNYVSVVVGY